MRKILVAAALVMATASTAQAQSLPLPPIPSPGQVSTPSYSNLNAPSPNWDHWGMQSLKADDGRLRRVVAKSTNQAEWARARRAAIAINANRCGEAAAIAAEGHDARLMEGVKRACKAV